LKENSERYKYPEINLVIMKNNIYKLDLKTLKTRVTTKYIILFSINSFILFYSYFKMQEKNPNYLNLILALLGLFLFLFYKNFKRQMKIFSETLFEIDGKILKLYGENSTCRDVLLSEIVSIKKDSLWGYPRLFIEIGNVKLNYFCIENIEKFEDEIQNSTGLKIEEIKRNPILILLKIFIIYLPGLITYFLTTIEESRITVDVLYIILNLNTIFIIQHFSEDKLEGGIPIRTARRIMIILGFLFCFQLFTVFG
jgi:hypothetical protein